MNSKNVCMIGGIGHNNDRLGVRGHPSVKKLKKTKE